MSLDTISQIGEQLSNSNAEQDDIKQNINPDEANSIVMLSSGETATPFINTWRIYKRSILASTLWDFNYWDALDSFWNDTWGQGFVLGIAISATLGTNQLGDPSNDLELFMIYNQDNTFVENFSTTHYRDSTNTTANWGNEIFKFTSRYTSGASANRYCYWKARAVSYTVQSGDVLIFDQYNPSTNSTNTSQGIELDTTTTNMRAFAVVDQNGTAARAFSASHLDKWLTRTFSNFGTLMVGQVLTFLDLIDESDTTATNVSYYRNIRIEDGSGNLRYQLLNNTDEVLNTDNYSADRTGSIVHTYSTLLSFDSTSLAAQSDYVAYNVGTINQARISVEGTNASDFTYTLAADGTNFEEVTPDSWHIFTNTGSALKWKATNSVGGSSSSFPTAWGTWGGGSGTPTAGTIERLQIEYVVA